MRRVGVSLLVVITISPAGAQQPINRPTASTVLAAAREALGGEKRLAAVQSVVATGRTRQIQGNNLVPIEFEISIELPDKYVRRDEIPARETGPTTIGFNGSALLVSPAPPPPPPGFKGPPPEAARQMRLVGTRQDFARLALGMFATSFDAYPLTFVHIGEAEAPQGKADVLEAKGAPNFTAQFFVHRDTHLPVMVADHFGILASASTSMRTPAHRTRCEPGATTTETRCSTIGQPASVATRSGCPGR